MAIDITDATITPNPVDALAQFLLALGVVSISELVELTRFTTSGTFNPVNFPSEDNRYIIMVLGAGGGSYNLSGTNYGAGGAGAMQFANFLWNPSMAKTTFTVTIGVAAVNSVGGTTSFDGIIAPGGGKATGTQANGVGGTIGSFTGEKGYSLNGGNSLFGLGALYDGTAATGYGAGGYEDVKGTNGLVIVYGWQ